MTAANPPRCEASTRGESFSIENDERFALDGERFDRWD